MMTRTQALRTALSLTQEALGRLVGVSQDTISRLERGSPERAIHTAMLDVVARQHALAHLTSDSFAACPPPQAAEEAPAASPGSGGHSHSETGGAA